MIAASWPRPGSRPIAPSASRNGWSPTVRITLEPARGGRRMRAKNWPCEARSGQRRRQHGLDLPFPAAAATWRPPRRLCRGRSLPKRRGRRSAATGRGPWRRRGQDKRAARPWLPLTGERQGPSCPMARLSWSSRLRRRVPADRARRHNRRFSERVGDRRAQRQTRRTSVPRRGSPEPTHIRRRLPPIRPS